MLKRKITEKLVAWKQQKDKKPLVIKGVRQCGKTWSVMEFAKSNYKHVIYLNFYENPDYTSVFSGSLKVDDLVLYMSALLGSDAVFEEGNTIIVLDEIQHCPNARTSLKFFKLDGRYDVIATGSLLGVSGYGEDEVFIFTAFNKFTRHRNNFSGVFHDRFLSVSRCYGSDDGKRDNDAVVLLLFSVDKIVKLCLSDQIVKFLGNCFLAE